MIGLLACAASRRENVVDLFSIYSCPTTNITAANTIASIAVANWVNSFIAYNTGLDVFARHRTIVDALSSNVTLLNLHFTTTAIIPGEEPDSARRHRLMDGECFTRLSDKHGQPLCINAACKHPKMEPTGSGRVGCLELLPAQARHQSVHEGRASISRLHQKDTVLILPRCAAAVALCCHHFR